MRKIIFCREPKQAHQVLTAVLWPLIKSWLLCGGGALAVSVRPETRTMTDAQRALAEAYHAHHFKCRFCIAAGRGAGYGERCAVGLGLWRAYQGEV